MTEPVPVADYALLGSVLRKLLYEGDIIVNEGGYLVMDNANGDPLGTMTTCVMLTPEEFAAVNRALHNDGEVDR